VKRADTVVRLPQMAALLGAGAGPYVAFSDVDAREAALATRRCIACRSKALCEEWLNNPRRGSPVFCPNAAYLRRLQHDARAFR
jgi:hypothetical protein